MLWILSETPCTFAHYKYCCGICRTVRPKAGHLTSRQTFLQSKSLPLTRRTCRILYKQVKHMQEKVHEKYGKGFTIASTSNTLSLQLRRCILWDSSFEVRKPLALQLFRRPHPPPPKKTAWGQQGNATCSMPLKLSGNKPVTGGVWTSYISTCVA